MRRFRFLLVFVSLVTLSVGVNTAAPPHSSAASTAAARSWTADNGNGTCSNPLFYEEFEDPDIIRVGEDYYLAGTTMHMNPAGKTITLTSCADGSFLAADTKNMSLINVAANAPGTAARSVRFQVVDLGKCRVALKAGNGRFVSAVGESVVLRDLAGRAPGNAESFQWINLMRGDTVLMSLTNHRYLATKPNNPRPVTVSATGPQGRRVFPMKGSPMRRDRHRFSLER